MSQVMVDSGVWIAMVNKKDVHHEASKKIITALVNGPAGGAVITDYIFDEVVTYIREKISPEASSKVSTAMLDSRSITLVHVDEDTFMSTFHVFQRYKRLSFTDASIVVVMKNHAMKTLYSFDTGFDGIDGITRLDVVS